MSSEHDVSIASGTSIISNLDKEKYDIYPIYISKEGKYYKYTKDILDIAPLEVGSKIEELEEIPNLMTYLEKMDLCFPVLHGKYGEDGSIQGLFKLLNKKYVGCDILASSLCMDKITTKMILEKVGIKVTPYLYIKKDSNKYIYYDYNFNYHLLNKREFLKLVNQNIGYPLFVKASNSGSSIGVYKVEGENDLIKMVEEASLYDEKILIEKALFGRELECAILGNDEVITSPVGEILSSQEYYSYESKYLDSNSKTKLASLRPKVVREIQNMAKRAYHACSCQGLARIDFFYIPETKEIILNEINTMPGFTNISMYPKLFQEYGYDYKTLLDKLIMFALK